MGDASGEQALAVAATSRVRLAEQCREPVLQDAPQAEQRVEEPQQDDEHHGPGEALLTSQLRPDGAEQDQGDEEPEGPDDDLDVLPAPLQDPSGTGEPSARHPLTPPAVRPATIFFCSSSTMMMSGMVMMVPAAITAV